MRKFWHFQPLDVPFITDVLTQNGDVDSPAPHSHVVPAHQVVVEGETDVMLAKLVGNGIVELAAGRMRPGPIARMTPQLVGAEINFLSRMSARTVVGK